MTGRDFFGAVVSGIALVGVISAVMSMPSIDDAANEKLQRLAEARMKARLFTKYPDPAIAQMSAPVIAGKDQK